jgi:hypothetical protein
MVEVMMAAFVLVIGLLGTVALIDGANGTTLRTKAREQGVSLERELVEAARSIPYNQLTPSSIVGRVQAMPGLGKSGSGAGWTIQRRGFTYQVSLGVCSVDDPNDGIGTEDPATFCPAASGPPNPSCSTLLGVSGSVTGDPSVVGAQSASLAGQLALGSCGLDLNLDGRVDNLVQADIALCAVAGSGCAPAPSGDSQPDDYKRIIALVAWKAGGRGSYALQSSTVPNPGQAGAPSTTALSTNVPLPITDLYSGTSIAFSATTSPDAATLSWSVDGTAQGTATGPAPSWTFSWNIGTAGSGSEVLDGTYIVGVQAFNQAGTYGAVRSISVTLNRRQAYAPTGFVGGRNGSGVDFEWIANRERDISGYRVYRVGGLPPDTKVCDVPAGQRDCRDTSPPASGTLQYYVLALDHDNAVPAQLREGDHSPALTVTTANQAPNPPTGLQASPSSGNTVLAWTPPSVSDPDGDPIAFYRIYRDGQVYVNRYDRTAGPQTTYTDTGTGGVTHTYWVTAVDSQLAESSAVGPVTL